MKKENLLIGLIVVQFALLAGLFSFFQHRFSTLELRERKFISHFAPLVNNMREFVNKEPAKIDSLESLGDAFFQIFSGLYSFREKPDSSESE